MKCVRVAHRGASGLFPENTMLAYRRAIEVGVDFLEVDVQLTRDGEIVIMHDETLERTTNGAGFVHEHSLAQLRELDAGRGERIPTLGEVFQLAREHTIRLCVEVKGVDEVASVEITKRVVAAIQHAGFVPYTVLTSFFPDALRQAKQVEPRLAALLDPLPQDGTLSPRELCEQTLAAYANLIGYNFQFVTREVVRESELTGLPLWIWAPNTQAEIAGMLELGVPGIVTDRPDVLNQVLEVSYTS